MWGGHRTYRGSKLTGLLPPAEVVKHREGGDPSTSFKSLGGGNKYESITLNRGVTQNQSFSDWASQVWNYGSSLGAEASLANFRKNIYLEFYNEAGSSVVTYKIYNGWVYEFPAMPPGGTIVHRLQPVTGKHSRTIGSDF